MSEHPLEPDPDLGEDLVEDRGEGLDAESATERRRRIRVAPLSLAVAAIVLALDQVTKHWAVNALSDGRPRHVLWTLQLNLAFNSGMAFSRGRGLGPVIGVGALVVVVAFVVASAKAEARSSRIAVGMLIGGALGNVSDRLFRGDGWLHGSVIDFIDFQWFPIFNVADIGVDVGAGLFILTSFLIARHATDAS